MSTDNPYDLDTVLSHITPLPDPKWTALNNLEEAFNQITTFDFLLTQLQEAVDNNDRQQIVDTTLALNAFYPPFCSNWDKKFKEAWKEVITKHPLRGAHQPKVQEWQDKSQWEEYWEKEVQKSKDQKEE